MDVAIGGETSVTVDNKPLSALSAHHATRPQFGATLPPQRVHHDYSRLLDEPISKSFKKD